MFLAVGNATETEFGDAVVSRHGAAQLKFLESYMGAKMPVTAAPPKSLVSASLWVNSAGSIPPMDVPALSKDSSSSGEAWVTHSELLYANEQFDLAASAIDNVPESFLLADPVRIELLRTKLALRGVGPLLSFVDAVAPDPILELNRALVMLRVGEQTRAIERLRRIADADGNPVAVRHRASIWMALLLHQSGRTDEALQALARINAGSPFFADTALAYLRIGNDVHPAAIAAILRRIEAEVPESPVVWELREQLVRALQAKGALSQSGDFVIGSIRSISDTLARLDKQIAALEGMSLPDVLPLLDTLPEGYRNRARTLQQRKENLSIARWLLNSWRPYVDSYSRGLRQGELKFADDVRDSIVVARGESQRDKLPNNNDLLGSGLRDFLGDPPEKDSLFRLFFGLAQWEFGFEYPEMWRPIIEAAPKELSRSERRARRARQTKDVDLLPGAVAHVNQLAEKTDAKLVGLPRYIYSGMADRADAISARNVQQAREIEELLPLLDTGVKAEVARGLEERKRIAQQWLNRFAFYALAMYSRRHAEKDPKYFDLDQRVSFDSDKSIVRGFAGMTGAANKRKAVELDIAVVRDALRLSIEGGRTRQIRADALRSRAQLVVFMYEAQAIPSVDEAIDDYKELLADYADLVDSADVMYQLARAQDLGQRMEQSLATLRSFVSKFPDDSRSLEVLFRIGEAQFALSEYPYAKSAYESVIKKGESRYSDQAEYKLAWTLLKLGEYSEAVPKFVAVIDRAKKSDANDSFQQNRIKDAYRSLSLAFSLQGGAPDVELFFREFGQRSYVDDIYYNLAKHYLDRDRINDAAGTYDYLIRFYPNDSRAPTLLAEVVLGARREKLLTLSLKLQERFVDDYAMSSAYWAQASEVVRAEINAHMKPFLAELGQMYHADGQQQRNAASTAKAVKYYGQYIQAFPEDEKTPHFHFLMAEAQFDNGDFLTAMVEYDKVAYQYGAHAEAAEAGYASLIANQKLTENETDSQARKVMLHALAARSGRFAAAFPGDLRVDAVLIKAAEDFLMLGDAKEAIKMGESLSVRKLEASVRRRASIVLAHGYFETNEFAKAEAAYHDALGYEGNSPTLQRELRDRLGLSVYRQGEAFRDAGDASAAIDAFLRVAKVAPGTESVPSAEIDASVLLIAAKRSADAIEVLERFTKNFPTHKFVAEIPIKLAYAYENDGRFLKSADMFEEISLSEPDETMARQLLWRSAELREKGGKAGLAVATYERYLKRYPAPLEKATEVRQMLAEIAMKMGNVGERDRWFKEILATVGDGVGQSVRVRFLAASAAVVFGDGQAVEFDAVKLELPLNKTLAAKRRAMEEALRWYEDAARYSVAEVTTAATYKTAEIYRRLSKDLMASERPGGLDALELGQYDILLEEQAFPFEEKATELHEVNFGRIGDGVYDEWVKRSMVSLRTLLPASYDRVELVEDYFDYVQKKPVVAEEKAVTPDGVSVDGGKVENKVSSDIEGVSGDKVDGQGEGNAQSDR